MLRRPVAFYQSGLGKVIYCCTVYICSKFLDASPPTQADEPLLLGRHCLFIIACGSALRTREPERRRRFCCGGVNMLLLPNTTAMFNMAGMLSPDGRWVLIWCCKWHLSTVKGSCTALTKCKHNEWHHIHGCSTMQVQSFGRRCGWLRAVRGCRRNDSGHKLFRLQVRPCRLGRQPGRQVRLLLHWLLSPGLLAFMCFFCCGCFIVCADAVAGQAL